MDMKTQSILLLMQEIYLAINGRHYNWVNIGKRYSKQMDDRSKLVNFKPKLYKEIRKETTYTSKEKFTNITFQFFYALSKGHPF